MTLIFTRVILRVIGFLMLVCPYSSDFNYPNINDLRVHTFFMSHPAVSMTIYCKKSSSKTFRILVNIAGAFHDITAHPHRSFSLIFRVRRYLRSGFQL